MFFAEFVFALFFGMLLTAVFVGGVRKHGTWANAIFFFVVVSLAAWAGGVWITPVGPSLWGVYWLSFFVVGLIFALLLAMILPIRPPRTRKEAIRRALEMSEEEVQAEKVLGFFFWFVVVALAIVIGSHYIQAQ